MVSLQPCVELFSLCNLVFFAVHERFQRPAHLCKPRGGLPCARSDLFSPSGKDPSLFTIRTRSPKRSRENAFGLGVFQSAPLPQSNDADDRTRWRLPLSKFWTHCFRYTAPEPFEIGVFVKLPFTVLSSVEHMKCRECYSEQDRYRILRIFKEFSVASYGLHLVTEQYQCLFQSSWGCDKAVRVGCIAAQVQCMRLSRVFPCFYDPPCLLWSPYLIPALGGSHVPFLELHGNKHDSCMF
jgi:hypothetical protein